MSIREELENAELDRGEVEERIKKLKKQANNERAREIARALLIALTDCEEDVIYSYRMDMPEHFSFRSGNVYYTFTAQDLLKR